MRPRRPGALAHRPKTEPQLTSLDLFLPLMKVDLDRRLVTGVATAETPDRSGEICDYASSKPYFEKWSNEALEASGGKSRGAVRAMHGRIAAGKLTGIEFDDEAKRVVVSAKIVDDDEWRKVTEGVYTGFSQGGRYVRRWPDPDSGLVRYTAEPHEISLVDLPCLPDATFEVVKEGVVEKRAFAPRADAASVTADTPPRVPSLPSANAGEESEARANAAASRETSEAFFKAAGELAEAAIRLERAEAENLRLRKALDEVSPALAALAKRVAALEAQPLPAKAAVRAVAKSADGEAEAFGAEEAIRRLAALPAEARALALTKLSLANPLRF
jgi:hypothetical protein